MRYATHDLEQGFINDKTGKDYKMIFNAEEFVAALEEAVALILNCSKLEDVQNYTEIEKHVLDETAFEKIKIDEGKVDLNKLGEMYFEAYKYELALSVWSRLEIDSTDECFESQLKMREMLDSDLTPNSIGSIIELASNLDELKKLGYKWDQEDPEVLSTISKIYYAERKYGKATEILETAIQVDQRNAMYMMKMASIYYRNEQPAEGSYWLEKALLCMAEDLESKIAENQAD